MTDPYMARGPSGTYHCKKCLTTHASEANYLIHVEGRRHKTNVDRSKKMEETAEQQRRVLQSMQAAKRGTSSQAAKPPKYSNAPAPQCKVVKFFEPVTEQCTVCITISFTLIKPISRPVHRVMSAYEQQKEQPPDSRFLYLLVACEPYRTIAIKLPNNSSLNRKSLQTHWKDNSTYVLTVLYDRSSNS